MMRFLTEMHITKSILTGGKTVKPEFNQTSRPNYH